MTIGIAELLDKNPRSTGKVMEELAKSEQGNIALIVAKSKKSNEKALLLLAKDLVEESSYGYVDHYMLDLIDALTKNPKRTSKVLAEIAKLCINHDGASYALNLAKRLVKNSKSSDRVMRELVKSDWFCMQFIVAKSKKSKEETLRLSAEWCANFPYGTRAKQLAKFLSKNPNSTVKVMAELANSEFPKVVSIGLKAIEKKAKKS